MCQVCWPDLEPLHKPQAVWCANLTDGRQLQCTKDPRRCPLCWDVLAKRCHNNIKLFGANGNRNFDGSSKSIHCSVLHRLHAYRFIRTYIKHENVIGW